MKKMDKQPRWKRRGETSKNEKDKELGRKVKERLNEGYEYSQSGHYECIQMLLSFSIFSSF